MPRAMRHLERFALASLGQVNYLGGNIHYIYIAQYRLFAPRMNIYAALVAAAIVVVAALAVLLDDDRATCLSRQRLVWQHHSQCYLTQANSDAITA